MTISRNYRTYAKFFTENTKKKRSENRNTKYSTSSFLLKMPTTQINEDIDGLKELKDSHLSIC